MAQNISKQQRGGAKATAEPSRALKRAEFIAELARPEPGKIPVWIRPPKSGTEFYTGLSRAKLYELAAAGRITTRTIREPGQIKGTRLFLLSSVLGFIESCPAIVAREAA